MNKKDEFVGMVIGRNILNDNSNSDCSMVFKEGHLYNGCLSSGVMDGFGRYNWCDGVIYQGDFSNGKVTGYGKYMWPDESSYIGEVLDGLRHGQGHFYCSESKTTYKGQWFLGKRHGQGRLEYDPDQSGYYDGHWVSNMKQGHGIEQFKSGDFYEGEWYQNKFHGNGTMHWYAKNEKYTGEWMCGVQHGHGKHIWVLESHNDSQYPLKNMYDGEWSNGVRDGHGSFYYASGAVYEGLWKKNKKCGQGKYFFKNCGEIQCYFINDDIARQKLMPSQGGFGSKSDFENLLKELLFISSESLSANDIKEVEALLLSYLTQLKYIYNIYSSLGLPLENNKSVLRRLKFSAFLRDIHIQQHGLSIFDAECITGSHKGTFAFAHDPETIFLMKDFLQAIILIAFKIYKQRSRFAHLLANFLSTIVMDAGIIHGKLFSASSESACSYLKYEGKLWCIYQKLAVEQSNTVTYHDALLLLKDCNIVDANFSSCIIMKIMSADIPDFSIEMKLSFLEFYEIMLRCAMTFDAPLSVKNIDLNQQVDKIHHFFEDHIFPNFEQN